MIKNPHLKKIYRLARNFTYTYYYYIIIFFYAMINARILYTCQGLINNHNWT
jgi:hypothetical protein